MNDLISRQDAIDALDKFNCCGYVEEEFIRLAEAIKEVPSAELSPCDVCRYYPPSAMDGKACTMCAAEGRE